MTAGSIRQPLDTTADVESPEHVRFHYHVAGPARRALAYLIDAIVRGMIGFAIAMLGGISGAVGGDGIGGVSSGLMLVALFGLEWGYYVACEMLMNGRSPGKAAMRLRVVTATGQPLHLIDSILRNLLRAADFLPAFPMIPLGSYAVGLVVMARNRRFQRLGDMVAGTMVVVEQRHRVSGPLLIQPPPRPDELQWFPERLPLSGDDLDAIELFLRRSGRLAPLREQELAEMVAPVYARRLGFHNITNPLRFLQLLYHRGRGARADQARFGVRR